MVTLAVADHLPMMARAEWFDVFISYAKEDELRAEKIAASLDGSGLRVFFAKQSMFARDPKAQEVLIRHIKRSRIVLLLWSRWVDKSEWVALELAVFATDRSSGGANATQRLVVIDRGGPPLPPWLPCDYVCELHEVEKLPTLLTTQFWQSTAPRECPPPPPTGNWIVSVLTMASDLLVDLRTWNARSRAAIPRVGPQFAISDLRKDDVRSLKLARLIRDALAAATLPPLFVMSGSLALWAWVLRFPIDWQGYVPKAIVISTAAALAGALIASLRIGVAAAAAGAIVAASCGAATALLAAYYGRPEPWAGGVAVGALIGAAAATAARTHALAEPARHTTTVRWTPFVGAISVVGLVIAGQYLVQRWLPSDVSTASGRALFAAGVGAVVFLPLAGITAWVAHLQIRLRHRGQAITLGALVWALLIAAMATAAATVPFGNPFAVRDGIGVGLLSGAVAAGLLTILTTSFAGVVTAGHAATWAGGALLVIGFPILQFFPNIQSGRIYAAVTTSALLVYSARRLSGARRPGDKE